MSLIFHLSYVIRMKEAEVLSQFYHRKQSCRHRDIISYITNVTEGKCHLLEAFLLECELIEMSASESFGAFFKLLQGNLSEYLISERKIC